MTDSSSEPRKISVAEYQRRFVEVPDLSTRNCGGDIPSPVSIHGF
jgi:hypothetical protein